MPQTNSRSANQRRRFQKQRLESRQRLAAVRAQATATKPEVPAKQS